MMSNAAQRSILRWVHLVLGIPIFGYIYGPVSEVQSYAPAVRFVFLPALVLSGFLMWKGPLKRPTLNGAREPKA